MAGYIFNLDSPDSLHLYATNGVYATKLSTPSQYWGTHHEGTFADYATMREGDNVYFFIKRKIYGIGRLIHVGSDCKYFNYPGAGSPVGFEYTAVKSSLLWDEGRFSADQRCVCTFEPDPHFFTSGIDMDDVLSSNPAAFRMLRAFWKVSFIKFDDEENQAFRDIVLKRNQKALDAPEAEELTFGFQPCHEAFSKCLLPEHRLSCGIPMVLSSCATGDRLRHEMAIEAGILYQLSSGDEHTQEVFGEWDYLSHQVVASPFKPVDYMDKMDLFGYSYIPGHMPTKSRFLVGEIKKDAVVPGDVDQLLKYVDWVRDEYCFGDYSMVRAFLVGHDISGDSVQHKRSVALRRYTTGMKPAQSKEWSSIQLVKYSFNEESARLEFSVVG
jgi:hypothetical protein